MSDAERRQRGLLACLLVLASVAIGLLLGRFLYGIPTPETPIEPPSGRATAKATGLGVLSGTVPPATSDGPSVVLITIDTLNTAHMGHYGYGRATTPNLDALFERSIVYEDLQAASPWTVPSVASILTGVPYSVHRAGSKRTRVGNEVTVVRDDVPRMAEWFKEQGYRTAAVVINPHLVDVEGKGFSRGFDQYIAFAGGSMDQVDDHYAAVENWSTVQRATFGRGGAADQIVDVATHLLAEERKQGTFLWLHFLDTHNPYIQRTAQWLALPCPAPTTPDRALWLEKEQLDAVRNSGQLTAEELEQTICAYDSTVAYLDRELGRLVQHFDGWAAPDAWLLVTTDHGEELMEHGAMGHGHTQYQEQLSSFLAAYRPGVTPASHPQMVRHVDIFPTVCGLVGQAPPELGEPLAPWFGVDLLDPGRPLDLVAVSENNVRLSPQIAVRTGHRKLIWPPVGNHYQLFDLATDPTEYEPYRDDRTADELRALIEPLRALDRGEDVSQAVTDKVQERLEALGYLQ